MSLSSLWCISEVIGALFVDAAFRNNTVVKLSFELLLVGSFCSPCLYYCDKKCDKRGSNSRRLDYETYELPTAPLSLSPLWCISEVIGALYVDAAFRNNFVVKLSFVLLLVGSCFPPPACNTVTKSATSEDRTHDLKIMSFARCRLRHCRCPLWCISEVIGALFVDAAFRNNTVVKLSFKLLLVGSFCSPCLYYCDKKFDKRGSNSRRLDYETFELPTAPLSLSPLWRISEVIGALYVDAAFRNNFVVKLLSFVLLLVGSCFSPPACFTVTKIATSEDRTHDLKIMRLTRCRLRHCRCLLYCASVKLLEPCTLMRHSGITLLSSYRLCCFWLAPLFPLLPVILWQKVRQVRIELTTLRLWVLRAADCAIVAVLYGASVKLLEPCTLMRHSGITLLSSYLLCCFWLALIFLRQPLLLWQKVRQVRIELTTSRLWDIRAADCAIVAVSFMVNHWGYWSLVRWCGIPEYNCCQAIVCVAFGWLWFFASSMYHRDKKCDKWGSNSRPLDYETFALTTEPLSLSSLWCISEVIRALYDDAAFRNDSVVKLSFVLLLVGSCFSSPACNTVTKSATSEDRTHDLKIMSFTRCRLRHCRCLLYGASVKLLEPCTLARHSGITLLSSYLLCCLGWLLFSPSCL